jgi:hypothetical protein
LKILKRKGYIDYVYNRNRTIRVLNEGIEWRYWDLQQTNGRI